MDIASPLRSDVLRPLLTWLVPGAVLIAPYLLLAGTMYPDVAMFAAEYSAIAALLSFFASLAAGVVLENLGSIIEVQVWDRLLDRKTGSQTSVWLEYLQLEHEREPIGQRYLRTVLMRLKFELAFALALIGSWFGFIVLDDRIQLMSADGQILFSLLTLTLAGYLLWESGRSAEVLTNIRALLVTKVDAPVMRAAPEPRNKARLFDMSIRTGAVVMLVGSLLAFSYTTLRSAGLEVGSGYTAIALWLGSGAALAGASTRDVTGQRREIARRIALLGILAFTLVTVRIATTQVSQINVVGAVWFLFLAIYFRVIAYLLPEEQRTPVFIQRSDPKDIAHRERS